MRGQASFTKVCAKSGSSLSVKPALMESNECQSFLVLLEESENSIRRLFLYVCSPTALAALSSSFHFLKFRRCMIKVKGGEPCRPGCGGSLWALYCKVGGQVSRWEQGAEQLLCKYHGVLTLNAFRKSHDTDVVPSAPVLGVLSTVFQQFHP